MSKEWKTFYCDVDNLESHLNWLETKGFEVYEVYQASEAGSTPQDGTNFLVVASKPVASANRILRKPEEDRHVSKKGGGGISQVQAKVEAKEIKQKPKLRQKGEVTKGKTCK